MPDTQKQIFLTNSPSRWQRFKWSFRIVLFIIILVLSILGFAVLKAVFSPAMPVLKSDSNQYQAIMNNGKDNESMREWALAKAATRNRLVSQFSGRAAEMDASMRSDPTYAKVVGAGVRNGDVPGLMVAQNVNRVELGGDQVLNQPPAVKKIDSLPKMPNHQMASAAGISKKHGYGLN